MQVSVKLVGIVDGNINKVLTYPSTVDGDDGFAIDMTRQLVRFAALQLINLGKLGGQQPSQCGQVILSINRRVVGKWAAVEAQHFNSTQAEALLEQSTVLGRNAAAQSAAKMP